jgi:23S rRNA-/tRNA-specific pseudouridylate synthase
MAHIGHPILGDSLYPIPAAVLASLHLPGPAAPATFSPDTHVRTAVQDLYPRLCLHAARLTFRHPHSGEQLTLSADCTVHHQPSPQSISGSGDGSGGSEKGDSNGDHPDS